MVVENGIDSSLQCKSNKLILFVWKLLPESEIGIIK